MLHELNEVDVVFPLTALVRMKQSRFHLYYIIRVSVRDEQKVRICDNGLFINLYGINALNCGIIIKYRI
jgi:hypothetical protein